MTSSKSKKCTIFGTQHKYEYKDSDSLEIGKKHIFNLLNEVVPDLIIIEQGYNAPLLDEFGGFPANDGDKERINEKHWAAIWAKENNVEIILTDLKENIKRGTSEKICCSKRESAISEEIIKAINNDYNNIILFCGKSHVDAINKIISGHTDVVIKYMNEKKD